MGFFGDLKDKALTKAGICIKCGSPMSLNAAAKNKDYYKTNPEIMICPNCKVIQAMKKLQEDKPEEKQGEKI